jgi:hypothetical protein
VKDMIGYIKRTVLIFSILFAFLLLFPFKTFAQTSISTDAVFSHTIKENQIIETVLTFTISSSEKTVLTYYTITIPQTDADPDIYSITRDKSLEATVYNRMNSTDILIDLENSVIDKDGSTKISLSYTQEYDDKNIISLISKVADTPTSKVSITYPNSWGETSWISDQIENIKKSDDNYILTVSEPDSDSIKLIFGENIIYSFQISKALNNPTDASNQYEVVLPPDTQFQKIVIEDINIQPTQALIDNNNNYILIFTLEPKSQIDLKISGDVIMGKHNYYHSDISTNYNQTDLYWSLSNNQIEDIEEYLNKQGVKDNTEISTKIKYLYKYVIETLEPTTSDTTLSGGVRKGAQEVLKSPLESSPEDYSDVLRALLAYYDIPAIYSIGYVSDISSYQESGMFHYWIQAFNNQNWMILDPYLEDFSNVSLFDREQLDHITILNRVHDSISPVLTYYSDNDISFVYTKEGNVTYNPQSNVSISLEPYSILNKYLYGNINVENTGNTVFTNIELVDSQPDLTKYLDTVTTTSNTILLPHMHTDLNFHIPFNNLEENMIFTTVNLKNGTETIDSQLVSTQYSISERTGYEVMIKIVSILLFLITFSILYIVINRFVYKK